MTRPVFFAKPKQPAEIVHIPGLDFAPALTLAGESIASVSDGVVRIFKRDTDLDVTAQMLVTGSVGVSNNVIAFQVKDGDDNTDYTAYLRPTTSLSRIVEGDIVIPVRARK